MRRSLAGLALAIVLLTGPPPARAQSSPPSVVVLVVRGPTFTEFARNPLNGVLKGPVAMLRGPEPSTRTLHELKVAGILVADVELFDRVFLQTIGEFIASLDEGAMVVVVGLAPTKGIASEGPDSVMVVRGIPAHIGNEGRASSTLTSDSTRRVGIVTPDDVAATIEAFVGRDLTSGPGEPVRVVASPPPVETYEKYLQYRELSAPIQTAVGLWEVVIAALAFVAVRRRMLLRLALGGVLSLPVLFLALLLVGYLPSLTYVTVVTTLGVVTTVAWLVLTRVADRRGIGYALAWSAGIGLVGLVAESVTGWNAALTPMLGGSQLDGFRFFGLPNAFLGLALGGAVLLATRVTSTVLGAGLVAVVGLWAGAPWFGSDIGGAVTLFAAAGLWWGIRSDRGWIRTGIVTVACVVVGTALVIFAHVFLTDAPTHIARFAEDSGGVAGIAQRATDRLQIGLRLLADQPPALIPVIGTLVALVVVLIRPPVSLRAGFASTPDARPAALTILIASVIAYLANDTGAAALGLGFGTAMVTLFAVSLDAAREKMDS